MVDCLDEGKVMTSMIMNNLKVLIGPLINYEWHSGYQIFVPLLTVLKEKEFLNKYLEIIK